MDPKPPPRETWPSWNLNDSYRLNWVMRREGYGEAWYKGKVLGTLTLENKVWVCELNESGQRWPTSEKLGEAMLLFAGHYFRPGN